MKKIYLSIFIISIIIGVISSIIFLLPDQESNIQANLSSRNRVAPIGFSQADGPRTFVFPDDFGPHNDFQTEWWYYTGNLTADNGDHYGYQLTFFRRALLPPNDRITRESEWAATQIYFAHFALTDVDGNSFNYSERFSRNGVGLAGSDSIP